MTDFRSELLQVLLQKVAATLQELDLDACGITDSQLEAFLPALSRCSQLRAVSLCGNLLSTAVMEKLLRHTAVLPCLRPERYPAPQESYRSQGVLLEARLAQLRAQLLEVLRDLGRPRIIWISPSPCLHCGISLVTISCQSYNMSHPALVTWCWEFTEQPQFSWKHNMSTAHHTIIAIGVCQSPSHVQLFVTPWTCSVPDSSVQGVLQLKTLEWVAIPFSRASFQPRDRT